jgi:hypothetical protein
MPARRCSSARNSWQLIPIALAVISARLSLGPRTKPMASSRAAIKGAGDGTGTGGGFGIAFWPSTAVSASNRSYRRRLDNTLPIE